MEWTEIAIDDKARFERFGAMKHYEVSDLSFTNCFIWHFSRTIETAVAGDFLCIRVTYPGRAPLALMPRGQGDLKGVLEKLIDDFAFNRAAFRMRALSKVMADEIEAAMPGRFQFTPERDRFDYVYRVSDLIELAGKAYRSKRNHLNRCRMMYDFSYEPLTGELVDAVAGAQIRWCQKHGGAGDDVLRHEHTGIMEALKHFDRLAFRGGALVLSGNVVAFTFDEALTDDMVVIHIEKADPDVHGAYQAINQQFLAHEWSDMAYVNREEDLGIEGLRQAKQSYRPVKMIEKYRCE